MSIGQSLVVGLVAGRQALLERQTFVLLGTLLGGGGEGQLIQRLTLNPRLLCQLPAVAPVLKLPGQRRRTAGHNGQHCSDTN
ncbi:hypothetical protein BK658_17635 [Pseudomonas brassicacearum]|uniref:Uncharacterized protein n=1 Tax=Pseudomonas brassicacearum TaxID=930166 RepID=A0A423GNX4_9PSED|nr:hypothetical protein BK658_17635 [Pseudomonas brassicacearum]